MKKMLLSCLATTALIAATPALAQSAGDWSFGIGVGSVNPKSDNGTLAGGDAEVDVNTRPIFTVEYFVTDNIGVELLASTPFKHDVDIDGIGFAGDVKHLPPTLSVNYHFTQYQRIKPYVGIGANYTIFFDEDSPLGDVSVDDSFGLALQLGADFPVTDNGALRLTARYIDIDADVSLDGTDIGEVEVDPLVLSASYVFSF